MSAPETNIDKQVSRHRGPLYGITIVLVFAAILFFAFLGWTSYASDPATPEEAAIISDN